MRKLYLLLFAFSFFVIKQNVWGQQLLVQEFNFSGALTANGWTGHSGTGTNPVSTTTGLTYAGYAGSGVGNGTLVNNLGGEDVNVTFASQNTNGQSIYYAFLANVTDAATAKTGDYFFHTGSPGGASWTAFAGRVFARIVGGNVNFGINNANSATYGTTNFARNTTYLIIVKYTINTGGADGASLWVIPSGVPASEAAAGTPELTSTSTGTDAINAVGLRQGSGTTSPQTVVDGIRVGLSWASAVEGSSGASISPSAASLSGFNYIQGSGPSTSQTFNVTASNLSPGADNIVVTGSANYEVSPDNAAWSGSFNIAYTGGALASTPVYVRLKSGLGAGTYNGETISLVGGTANASVTLNGSVTSGSPVVIVNPTALSGFITSQGTASASQSFDVSGNNLTADIIVTAPTDYEVSLTSGSGYGTSVSVTHSGGTVATTAIFVRIRASATAGSPSGNVNATSTGATTQDVAVSGTVNPSPSITVTPGTLTGFTSTQGTPSASQSFDVSGSTLSNDIIVTAPANYEVSLNNSTFSPSVTLVQSGGIIATTPVFLRLKTNASVGSPSGNVTAASTGATTRNVTVSGTVTAGTPMPFTAGNLTIYRVGDGSATLAATAAPVYIDEFTPAGSLVQTIVLPTSASGSNKALTAAGNATTEGLITRSTDKRYLMISGYDATVGTAAVNGTASSVVNRVVGRIAYNASIDATTSLTDFASSGNPRGVTSTNGTDIWVSSGADGVKYTTLGASTTTQLTASPTNVRGVNIFDNQLYISSGSTGFRLATVGSGVPATAGQTATNLTGFPTATGSPYGFFFADLDAGVAGVDVVYVADDGAGTGFQKYSLVAGNWVANGNIAVTGNGLRGITGIVSGSTVTLYGTSGTNLFGVTDASGYNATITGTMAILGAAGANTAFRGIAFAPENISLPVRFSSLKATQKNSGVQLNWSNATEENVVDYTIERSANGRSFSKLDKVNARNNNGDKAEYSFVDASPFSGDNFYRIKAVETTGKTVYTNIVRINTTNKGIDLVIYPNPVKGSELNVQFNNLPTGKYIVKVYAMNGQEVGSQLLSHAGGSLSETLSLKNLKHGIYSLQVSGVVTLQKTFVAE